MTTVLHSNFDNGKGGNRRMRDYKLAIIIDGLLCVINTAIAIASPNYLRVFCAGFTFGVFALLCGYAILER